VEFCSHGCMRRTELAVISKYVVKCDFLPCSLHIFWREESILTSLVVCDGKNIGHPDLQTSAPQICICGVTCVKRLNTV
jgi:hypothetical protein